MEEDSDMEKSRQIMWKRLTHNAMKEIVSWCGVVVLAVALALFVNQVIIVNAKVPSGSMEDTIMTEDRIAAFRLAYLFSEPERFDIVVFRFPDDESILFVKRIIGLPGDTVNIIDGKVYLNGDTEPLDDSFTKDLPTGDAGPFVVPKGYYFMMGDNRNNSRDSRYWNNKYVAMKKILGKVIFKYYPGFELYTRTNAG